MAIIYSYPLNTPKRDDLLIGTITYDEDAVNPVHGNPTVSFTVGSLLDLIASQGAAQNLQQVTNIGNTTSNSIIISNNIKVSGGYYDSSNQPGTSGQLLSSTATGTQWVNVAAQGVTSVGLSMPTAFTVTNSPITQSGVLTVTGAGTAAQYINGLGNLVTFPTIPTQYVLPVATTVALGGIKIGYTETGKNYPLELDSEQAYVNVPWTDTVYTLPLAADGTRGGVQIGYAENAKNYPVELSSEKMFVNVPWTDTTYVLPVATSTDLGGVKIGYTTDATARNYAVSLDTEQMLVNVPWTDTQNPFQTITGTGTDNTDSGVLLSNSGGTVLILGDGSVTAAQTGNTITLTGTDTGITGVTLATADSTGAPLVESITTRELTITSSKYVGGANVGYVPEGGTSSTYLKGDGTWEAIPTGLVFKGTWDASGGSGGSPDLTLAANKGAGFLWICDVAGTAYPNGGTNEPSTWALGDWCVYDGSAWTRVPATNSGVTSVTTTDGTYIDLTPDAATTGAVTVTADLSAVDGTSDTSTKFLSKDNTWDVPSYTTDTNTQNIYTNSWQQSTNDIILRKVLSGAGSGTQDIKIVKGANITFTYTDADNFTIAATDTQENTTWYVRDSADADKTVNNLKYLKFVTATGTLGTALTGAGSTGDPYVMTLTSPDTNTQNTYTAGTGLSLNSFQFNANVDSTAQSTQPETVSTDSNRTYAVQVDDTNDKLVVNVPWSSGGTYDWTVKDNASNQGSSTVSSGNSIKFVTATGDLGTVLTDPNSDGNFVMTLTSPDEDTLYALAGAADGTVAANYNLVLSADGTTQDTMIFKQGSNVTFTRAANSLTIAAANDNDQYALAGAASATAGEYDLVLSNDGTDQDTMVFKQGSNITFTRAADLLTIAATNTWNANTKTVPGYVAAPGAVANKVWKTNASGDPAWRDDATIPSNTYTLSSGNTKVITLNDTTGTSTPAGTVTFADGADISISGNNGTITIASTFVEADTLQSVTDRGDTTTTKSYFNGDLEVNDTITVKRTGSNNGKISIEGNPPSLELKNYDGQTTSDQLLSTIQFYGSDTSSTNVAGVRASINCNTGFDDPTGTSNRNQGCLEFATYNGTDAGNAPVQRLKITPDGGFSFGGTSTAYGTSGQLLKSNGDAPPSWVNSPVNGVTSVAASTAGDALDVGGTPITSTGTLAFTWAGADTEYIDGEGNLVTFPDIPQGDITKVTAGTDLTGGGSSGDVTLNNSSTLATVTGRGASTSTTCTFNADLVVKNEITVNKTNVNTPGKITINGNLGATLQLKSEDVALAANETIGIIEFYGSDGTAPGAGVKSSIRARNGDQVGGSGDKSNLIFAVSDGLSNNNEALRINPTGSIAIDGATKYGTSGQVLTSAGDAPPTWETPASDENYYLDGITKSGNKLTFSVNGTTNQEYTFGSNAFNSTTIPTNNNQLTNGAGYITSYSETDTLANVVARGDDTDAPINVNTTTAASTFSPLLYLSMNATAGTGSGIVFRARSGAGGGGEYSPNRVQGNIYTTWTTVADPTRTSDMVFQTTNSGTTATKMTIAGNGDVTIHGNGNGGSVLNLNGGVAPNGGAEIISTTGGVGGFTKSIKILNSHFAFDHGTGSSTTFIGLGDYEIDARGAIIGQNMYAQGSTVGITSGGSFVFGASTSEGVYISRPANTTEMNFYTGSNPRITIESGGQVGVNNTSPGATLHLTALASNGVPFKLQGHDSTTVEQMLMYTSKAAATNWYWIVAQADSVNQLIIYGNGDIKNKNNSYGQISDVRLKENIVDAKPKLEDIKKLKVKNFNLIGDDLKQIGLIAQEVEEVFPGLVNEDKEPDIEGGEEGGIYKSVKYSVLVPILIKAMQEQQEIIDDLKLRIEQLEN